MRNQIITKQPITLPFRAVVAHDMQVVRSLCFRALCKEFLMLKITIKSVPNGHAYIQATYNNTLITMTDQNGNVIGWSSAGKVGFRGPKKATPYAASLVVKDLCERLAPTGLREVVVFVRGIGAGRDSAIRALNANGLVVTLIKDVTPIPHNGCRPLKPRRI